MSHWVVCAGLLKIGPTQSILENPTCNGQWSHYRCGKIGLDTHLQCPCYIAQLELVFCFILNIILNKLCKVLFFVIIETNIFGCFWWKNIGKLNRRNPQFERKLWCEYVGKECMLFMRFVLVENTLTSYYLISYLNMITSWPQEVKRTHNLPSFP